MPVKAVAPSQRFWPKVEKTDGCWIWRGATHPVKGEHGDGYGQFMLRKTPLRFVYAHRFAYEEMVGAVPDGLQLDHLCRNRQCVNPEHLEPVTPRENQRRAHAGKRTCVNGHPYEGDNIYVSPGGHRQCRICRRAAEERRAARR